jgi:tyrosine-protein phosphatase SIW14
MKKHMTKYLLLFFLLISTTCYAEPRVRPETWGKPIIGTNLENIFLVDKDIYRSEQPKHKDIPNLQLLGIKEVLNLREFHSDKDDLMDTDLMLHRVKMHTSNITEDQIITSLRIIKNKKGPILVHCWHGSDRTGVTIAAYRIIFNNWTKSQALDEMTNGGYGYHSYIYPELVSFIEKLDIKRIKNAVINSN